MGFLTSRGVRPVLLLIALVACLAPGAGEAAILKQVTASSIILPGNTVNNVALANVTNINKAFVACQTETSNTAPSTMIATCELTTDVSGNAQLTITTGATVTNNTILVQVLRGRVLGRRDGAARGGLVHRTNTTPGSAPSLTAVDCTKSFVLLTERSTSTSTTADETWLVRGILGTGASPCTSSTTTSLELTRLDAVNGVTVSVAWQVVTMEGASVQRGTSCIGGNTNCTTNAGGTSGTSNRITLGTAVDTTKSFISRQLAGRHLDRRRRGRVQRPHRVPLHRGQRDRRAVRARPEQHDRQPSGGHRLRGHLAERRQHGADQRHLADRHGGQHGKRERDSHDCRHHPDGGVLLDVRR
jgi:hypothetical protein